jgi:hypothetical protein
MQRAESRSYSSTFAGSKSSMMPSVMPRATAFWRLLRSDCRAQFAKATGSAALAEMRSLWFVPASTEHRWPLNSVSA